MKSIQQKITDKGVTKKQVAKMVGIDTSTLSRILSGKQEYTSQAINDKLHTYLDAINTDDKNIFKKD